jgi:hypothetical protein
MEIGYLEHDTAREFLDTIHHQRFTDAACEAVIVGGWNRGGNNRGYYGVQLKPSSHLRLCPPDSGIMRHSFSLQQEFKRDADVHGIFARPQASGPLTR